MSSPRVSREDVEEWGDESTRVEAEVVVSPLGSARKGKNEGMVSSGSKKRKFDDADADGEGEGRADGAVVPSKLIGSVKRISSSKSKATSSAKPASSSQSKPSSSSKPTGSSKPTSSSKPTDQSASKQSNNNNPSPTTTPQTLNARYEINPDANNGLGFQYDEVVRGKHKRSKMCAVDCEDCRAVSYLSLPSLPPLPSLSPA